MTNALRIAARPRASLTALTAALAMLAGAGCASPTRSSAATTASPSARPSAPPIGALAGYAGRPLVVFPLQRVTGDSATTGTSGDSLRRVFDDALLSAARDKGVSRGWALAADLERSARRNPGFVADPHALTVGGLASRRSGDGVSGPLGGEVRGTVALHDARFAVVPHLLKVATSAIGRTATLSLVVIDARLAQVAWRGDVAGEGATDAAAIVSAADRMAALFVAP